MPLSIDLSMEVCLTKKDIYRIEGFSFYSIFLPFNRFFSPSLAILAPMPRMYFRVVRNDDLRVGEITR